MRSIVVALLFSVLALTGCDQKAWLAKFIPEEEAAFAKSYLAQYQTRNFAAVEAQLDPSILNPETRATLRKIASLFPRTQPKDIQVIGAQTTIEDDIKEFNLTFQYEYPDRWLLANVVLQRHGKDLKIIGVHVSPLTDSLENIHRFSLDGKSALQYTILGLAIIVPIFIVITLIQCIKTPVARRKWAWILFILMGLCSFKINWTDGSLIFSLVSFQLLGAGFFRASTYAPLMLSVSIPLGAIMFQLKREKLLAASNDLSPST